MNLDVKEKEKPTKKGLEHDAEGGVHMQRHRGMREPSRAEDLQIILKVWNVERPGLKLGRSRSSRAVDNKQRSLDFILQVMGAMQKKYSSSKIQN